MRWPPTIQPPPVLETPRFHMRVFEPDDAVSVFNLVSDVSVSKWTARIPHPYELKMADEWISDGADMIKEGRGIGFAIVTKDGDDLTGAVGFDFEPTAGHAEIGYYLGKNYWNRGYMTEAATALLNYGFDDLGLEKVLGCVVPDNLGSATVLKKLGFSKGGSQEIDAPARGQRVLVDVWTLGQETWVEARKGRGGR